ncbi:Maf family protein [Vagococcus salmoninarum]|uniref:Maf family protein n=1 Tax=Vagococcus salmoninarum TaxID=2739 RepID=UPI00187F0C04|nr:Maf family protein [Vagococcus salmoninarum]MBE9388284.1 septum formation protein Maf [Vagococcus salmoninarum]
MAIILASQSPRRKELLGKIVKKFQTMPAEIDESVVGEVSPEEYVLDMAQKKAQLICKRNPDNLVIGSDTIVAVGNEILGKPANDAEAFAMLRKLSGSSHLVHTSVYMMNPNQIEQQVVSAEVTFFDLTDEEINEYLATGEHLDKAGAYGIQGQGSLLVEKITGDYFAIVGFPVAQVKRMLAKFK